METNVATNVNNILKRTGHIAVCDGRFILVWGGYRDFVGVAESRYLPSNHIWVYDSLLDVWKVLSTGGNAPPGTSGAAGALIDDNFYVLGGYSQETLIPKNTNDVFKLNVKSRKWIKIKTNGAKPLPCDKMTSWIYEDKIYLFGGFGPNPNRLVAFNPPDPQIEFDFAYDFMDEIGARGWNNQLVIFDPVTSNWLWPKCNGLKPLPRAAHAAVRLDNFAYVFGGRHQNTRMNDLHCFDLRTSTWSGSLQIEGPVPKGRSWHSLNVLSDTKLVLFGGFSQERMALSDCWIFHTNKLYWQLVEMSCLEPRVWHTSCLSNYGELIVIGGCCNNILGHTETVYPNHWLSLGFSPKSLFRIALDAAASYKTILSSSWQELPKFIQKMLCEKIDKSIAL